MPVALGDGRWLVERRVSADASLVWAVLTDLAVWPEWGPTVSRARLESDGPFCEGSRGTVWTAVGLPLPFVVSELLPGRRWSWRVAGVPATSHWVVPEEAGCRVGMSAPLWAPGYVPVLAVALRRIDELTSGSSFGASNRMPLSDRYQSRGR